MTSFRYTVLVAVLLAGGALTEARVEPPPFDGRPWNISTGNFSMAYVQGPPVGAFPKRNFSAAAECQAADYSR